MNERERYQRLSLSRVSTHSHMLLTETAVQTTAAGNPVKLNCQTNERLVSKKKNWYCVEGQVKH